MVAVLKGIRNIGLMTGEPDNLIKCYKTTSNSMWVRVAAVETAQTLSCHNQGKEFGLLQTLADGQEDSELRIASYRAVMACPNEAIVDTVKMILEQEEVNQGQFSE